MKTFAFLTAILGASLLATAQITFEKTYGGEFDDSGKSVLQTDDNGYIISGAFGTSEDGEDVYLIKTDENGNVQWYKTYGGPENEFGVSVLQTSDCYFILCRKGEMPLLFDIYLIKINENGDTIWTKTYGDNFEDHPLGCCQTNDDAFVITGEKGDFPANTDVFLMKINEGGDIIWTKTYGGQSTDYGSSVNQTNDNGFIIAGETYSFGAGNSDVYLIKTNEDGDTLWTRNYGGTSDEYCRSVFQTTDNGYIILGHTMGVGSSMFLLKTNAEGDSLWTKILDNTGWEYPSSMARNNDNGYIITGCGSDGNLSDVYLMRTDESGNILWTKTFGSTWSDVGYSVEQTNDNGFIISGETNSFTADDYDVYLIKTDANGNVLGVLDYLENGSNSLVFPNPCKGLFNIDLKNFDKNITEIEIYNLNNQKIYCRNFNKVLDETIQVDLSTREKGIYLLKIQTNEGMEVKKLAIQ